MNGKIDTKCICHMVCHDGCFLGYDADLKGCWCMDGDICRICGHHAN
jgi:hypothetical protein